MTRRNVAVRKSNDNIDQRSKIFFLMACIEGDDVLTFLILGPILN